MATIISDGNGTGYYLHTNDSRHPEYVNHSKVDSNNTYGGTFNSFPRRNTIGGSWKENTISGSRSVIAYCSTARAVDFIS